MASQKGQGLPMAALWELSWAVRTKLLWVWVRRWSGLARSRSTATPGARSGSASWASISRWRTLRAWRHSGLLVGGHSSNQVLPETRPSGWASNFFIRSSSTRAVTGVWKDEWSPALISSVGGRSFTSGKAMRRHSWTRMHQLKVGLVRV
eukprot:6191536-Amphidinium_carterae.6